MTTKPDPKRRRLLAGLAAIAGGSALGGCLAIGENSGATDVVALNTRDETVEVSITVTSADADDPRTSRTLELAPGEAVDPVNDGKLPEGSDYTVEVDVVDGPSETFEWADVDIERAPLWVLVDGSENIKFLLQAG